MKKLHLSDLQRWPSGWTAYVEELGDRVPLPWGPATDRETVVAHQRGIGNIVTDEPNSAQAEARIRELGVRS